MGKGRPICLALGICALAVLGAPAGALAASADLSTTGSAPTNSVAGTDVAFTFTVTNNGPDTATSSSLSIPVPAHTTFASLSVPAGWTSTAPPPGGTGTVTATKGSLTFGAGGTFILTLHLAGDITSGTEIGPVATISSATPDANGANNTAKPFTTVRNPAALSITATASPKHVEKGQKITYKLSVANASPFLAINIIVSASIPAGTKLISSASPGWAPAAGGAVKYVTGLLPAGQSALLTLAVKATKGKAKYTQTASVTTFIPTDPDLSDNSATVTVCGKKSGGQSGTAAKKKGCK
jgi:uncharacterized repeat protein (TIGR01451 family)